jgi:hypothetical protein
MTRVRLCLGLGCISRRKSFGNDDLIFFQSTGQGAELTDAPDLGSTVVASFGKCYKYTE